MDSGQETGEDLFFNSRLGIYLRRLYSSRQAFDESGPGVGGPALGGAEMPNGPSAELHPHSPGPAPLLGNEEEGTSQGSSALPGGEGTSNPGRGRGT